MKTAVISVETDEGPKNIAYTQWGSGNDDTPIFCVHGLTRNSRDFDYLAKALSESRTVICIDIIGRGDSDWFEDKSHYGYPIYIQLCLDFLKALNIQKVDWIGTSMGGLIGMMIAAQDFSKSEEESTIRKLVLNDVGSFIPKAALERIGDYVGNDPEFELLENAEQYLRLVMRSFGQLTNDQWRHISQYTFKKEHGKYKFKYDPTIALPFEEKLDDVDLSAVWNLVGNQTLLLRGTQSDLLLKETAEEMEEKENCQLVEIENVGHAPMLMSAEEIAILKTFIIEAKSVF